MDVADPDALNSPTVAQALLERGERERGALARGAWTRHNIRMVLDSCDFCGRPRRELEKVVAGRSVLICGLCIEAGKAVLLATSSASVEHRLIRAAIKGDLRCSFCGRLGRLGEAMATTDASRICSVCLASCEADVETWGSQRPSGRRWLPLA